MLLLQAGDAKPFEDCFTDCRIWFDLEGSDHAPVWADLRLPAPLPKGNRPPPLDARNRQSSTGADLVEGLHAPKQRLAWHLTHPWCHASTWTQADSQAQLACFGSMRVLPVGAVVIPRPGLLPTGCWRQPRWLTRYAGKKQEQLSNMFSKHTFSAKRKAKGEAADLQRWRKGDKQQRSHEDTPEREGLDGIFV